MQPIIKDSARVEGARESEDPVPEEVPEDAAETINPDRIDVVADVHDHSSDHIQDAQVIAQARNVLEDIPLNYEEPLAPPPSPTVTQPRKSGLGLARAVKDLFNRGRPSDGVCVLDESDEEKV